MTTRRVLLVALLVLSTAFMACKRTAIITPENTIPETPGQKLTLDEIGDAIMRGGSGLQWAMTKEAPGRILATLVVRSKHSITVNVNYTETSFAITYQDSMNMKYDGTQIHRRYNLWVMNLSNAITREINLALDGKSKNGQPDTPSQSAQPDTQTQDGQSQDSQPQSGQ